MIEVGPATVEYMGRTLKLEDHQKTVMEIAEMLEAGKPVGCRLEPGDGTRYQFILVPMWTNMSTKTIARTGTGWGTEIMFAPMLTSGKSGTFSGRIIPGDVDYLEYHRGNRHSLKIIAAFINRLWDALDILRGNVTEVS